MKVSGRSVNELIDTIIILLEESFYLSQPSLRDELYAKDRISDIEKTLNPLYRELFTKVMENPKYEMGIHFYATANKKVTRNEILEQFRYNVTVSFKSLGTLDIIGKVILGDNEILVGINLKYIYAG